VNVSLRSVHVRVARDHVEHVGVNVFRPSRNARMAKSIEDERGNFAECQRPRMLLLDRGRFYVARQHRWKSFAAGRIKSMTRVSRQPSFCRPVCGARAGQSPESTSLHRGVRQSRAEICPAQRRQSPEDNEDFAGSPRMPAARSR
jgi:hypothetical protein